MKYETAILQNEDEVLAFITILRNEAVKSYLEIGCKFGGSLWAIGNALPVGSRIVAVDLPHGDTSFKETLPHLQDCVKALNAKGYEVHLIIGDSTDRKIINEVSYWAPFDACLVDANHTLPYITKDWVNYSALTHKLMAFHDINFSRPTPMPKHKKPIEVPQFWNVIKHAYRHVEIKHDKQDNGIGVLWL
jgi:predicted O-methyltransferase YrrM